MTNAVEIGESEMDGDVDHLLASPRAGVVIDISLIVGSAILIGVLTGSALAVGVVFVGAAGFALMLSGLDLVGEGRSVTDLTMAERRLSVHDQHVGRSVAHEVAWIPANRPGSGQVPDP